MISISNEIKGLLAVKGIKQIELLDILGVSSQQAISAKFSKERWTAQELINVIEFLGGELTINIDGRSIPLRSENKN